jgi:Tfp pilus assembly protein PilV
MPGMSAGPRNRTRRPRLQQGSFLLEALISVFIIALAILGLTGLIARSIQNVDESKYRGEAAALATSFIGNMWVDNRTPAALKAKYESGGAAYTELQSLVTQRLPNAVPPVVSVVDAVAATGSSDVTITLQWRTPGDPDLHTYTTFATIGANN